MQRLLVSRSLALSKRATTGFLSSSYRKFQTSSAEAPTLVDPDKPGSAAFADVEKDALVDLWCQFAKRGDDDVGYLDLDGVRALLSNIGERVDEKTLLEIFQSADLDDGGTIDLQEFLMASDKILGNAPARVVLVVGGPGSGKRMLCERLASECNAVHVSSGDLLRAEVAKGTLLGKECESIMSRGELVSSAVIVTLLRRRMRSYSRQRVLLDGFPRSVENAHGFVEMCGKPELALHLECDDTILMERLIKRSRTSTRPDEDIDTALQRLRNYNNYHGATMDWLREQQIPTVEVDCSGSLESMWKQLLAIGRLMRPVARHKDTRTLPEDWEIGPITAD